MTPKEKAQDLFDKMYSTMPHPSTTNAEIYIISKHCAIEAVDEILKLENNNGYYFDGTNVTSISYWQEVKQEIEKL